MKIEFASKEDKILFLRYAIPCGITLMNRGDLDEAVLDNLRQKTASGDVGDVDPEGTFKIAVRMCYLTARKLGKEKIDSEVVREYFWHDHEDAVNWRSEVFRDIRIDTCKVYPGKVVSVGEHATVSTEIGSIEFRRDFVPNLNKGDFVVTHYDHVVEKISEETAKKLGFTF
jgi:hydrogenase maturation factor